MSKLFYNILPIKNSIMTLIEIRKKQTALFLTYLMIMSLFPFTISCPGQAKQGDKKISPEVKRLEKWEYRLGDLQKDNSGNYIFPDMMQDSNWFKSYGESIITTKTIGNIVWFRIEIPDLYKSAPAVFVNRAQQKMSVYLDAKKIYDNSVFINDNEDISALGFRWWLIKLPVNFHDKFLYFRFYSESKKIGMSVPVLLGPVDKFLSRIVYENSDEMIIGSVIILTGIVMMIILIFFKRTRFFLALTIFSFGTGIFICVNNPYINLLIDNVDLLNYLNSFSLFLQPVLFMVVEELVIEKYKKILRIMWKIHVGYIILTLILTPFPGITIVDLEDPFLIMLVFNSNFSIFTLFKSISKERIEAVILLIGTIIFSFIGTAEILLYYFNFYSDTWYTTTYIFHWGAFIFIICLVILAGYRYLKEVREKEVIQKQVVQQQKLALEAIHREKKLQEQFTHQLLQSQDNERKRIAMELHDAIGQELLVIKNMALLSLKFKNIPAKQETISEYISDISETTSSVIENVRNMSRSLHPFQLDNLGLTDSVEALINRICSSTNIRFKYKIDNINKLFEKEKEVHIYRIIQECINNILKHSDASDAEIKILRQENAVNIFISDNGKGLADYNVFNNKTGKPGGFGISGIYERVNILGGTVEFKSEANKGMSVSIKILLNKN